MKKKKNYLRPAITCVAMDKGMLLVGTTNIEVSKENASGPACSKESEIEFFSPWEEE